MDFSREKKNGSVAATLLREITDQIIQGIL